jgi:bacteriocin-like protein
MRQLTEITELSDTELDAVSGGFTLNFGNIITQPNIGLNVAVGLGSFIQQMVGQASTA